MPLLLVAFIFLLLVLIPGIGHEVNGSRRWLRAGVMNFQASELARVLLLIYLCELRGAPAGGIEGRAARASSSRSAC